jgi:hypothetical protein
MSPRPLALFRVTEAEQNSKAELSLPFFPYHPPSLNPPANLERSHFARPARPGNPGLPGICRAVRRQSPLSRRHPHRVADGASLSARRLPSLLSARVGNVHGAGASSGRSVARDRRPQESSARTALRRILRRGVAAEKTSTFGDFAATQGGMRGAGV